MTNLEINLAIYAAVRIISDLVIAIRNRKNKAALTRLEAENAKIVPHVHPPDQETAENALLRKRVFYAEQAKAEWRGPEYVKQMIDKANSAQIGLLELFPEKYHIEPKHQ
jgi:hypothetical protein